VSPSDLSRRQPGDLPGLDDTSLEAPTLLIAMPQVVDPYFHKSVVLLAAQDDDEGSSGFIINRPTGIRIHEILEGLEMDWRGDPDLAAYFGGPVQPELGSVLFTLGADEAEGGWDLGDGTLVGAKELAPGVAITQHMKDLSVLAADPPEHLRLLLGYAGWGEGQLIEEILRDDWLTAPLHADNALALLFNDDPTSLWEQALRSVGVDPATLPSWTAGHEADESN
jgi:putative transcriptional regulator